MELTPEFIESVMAMNAQLLHEVSTLKEKIKQLEARIDQLSSNSQNSSKPPSSDIVKPPTSKPKKKGKRRPGGQPGHKKFERIPFPPDKIYKTIRHEIRGKRVSNLIPLDEWSVLQQCELRESPIIITEHRARKYLNPETGKIITAPIPAEVRAAGLFGPRLASFVGFLNSIGHMSITNIQTCIQDIFGISVSRGYIDKLIKKLGHALNEPYVELRSQLPQESNLGVDETGYPECGKLNWAWCFRAPSYTVFHINESRGSKVLLEVLTKEFGGVIGCDYFSAYHRFMKKSSVVVQFCMAHLIRDIRFIAEATDRVLSRWGKKLMEWIKKLFKTLHRHDKIKKESYARTMKKIRKGFLQAVRRPPSRSRAETLTDRFRGKKAESYFTFLTTPGVEPTNNLTEQALRPLVIDKRITQGTRSINGRHCVERIWTVVATCLQQKRSAYNFMLDALTAYFNRTAAPSLLS